ncbi:IPT/TIG domain-containing protein [Streptomyces sp. MnatMP-M17]|nr:IPT/TIG domain-containing protein [Streptomyces sp. MnatMP-M17]
MQAVSPAGAGATGVTLTTAGGTSGPANFYYLNPPAKASANPTAGPLAGGTAVTITGTNLTGATAVTFGGTAGTITANTAASLTATTPTATTIGPVPIVVTTPGGSTDGLTFTYTAVPTITSVLPATGSTVGGDVITITGTGLGSTTQVTFGGGPTSFEAASDTQLVVTTATHTAGVVDVDVASPGGSATASGAFTYQTPPG